MDRFSVCWQGTSYGTITVCEETLCTRFCVRCHVPGDGLWCVWLVGTKKELRLGVLEPCGDEMTISRRFSESMTKPMGEILRGELRKVESAQQCWNSGTALPVKTPWIRQQLAGRADVLTWCGEAGKKIAVPYLPDQTFPLIPLFCFATPQRMEGKNWMVFSFDREDFPVFGFSETS